MNKEQIKSLLLKYDAGNCTAEEKALLEHWFFTQHADKIPDVEDIEADRAEVWQRLQAKPAIRQMWSRFAVAASVILLFSAGGYFIFRTAKKEKQLAIVKQDILPGHNQATLVLANGKNIILTKGLSGQLATQGQTSIVAAHNNITYSAGSTTTTVSYNTMITAKGQQSPYPLILADGTKVWLNADSKITFPTAFLEKERIVKLTGEAYFEVAKDQQHPFIVSTNKQDVKVLGTHFNISSYDDDPATLTTLLEGRVQVTVKENHISGLLKPGQQSVMKDNNIRIATIDTDEAVAWKDGYFMFESGDIQSIMRKVARWYNVEIVYEGPIPQTKFYLVADRFSNVSGLLKPLETSNRIHFKIEERRIIVSR